MFNLPISPYHFRIFLGTFFMTFLVVSLQVLGVRMPGLVSPLSQTEADPFIEVVARLQEKETAYTIQKQQRFIPAAHASSELQEASAYTLIDFDSGKVIIEKNGDAQTYIASITKVMTSVVALDLAEPDELFTVTRDAAKMIPTKIGVVPGQKLSVKELIQASMLTSGNDAAEVLKEGIDAKYGDGTFIRAMNEKAKFLGMHQSSFQNAQGFDHEDHYSSAHDVALLTHYAMTQYPLFAEIAEKDYAFLPEDENHKQYDLVNWNGLIGVYPNTSGVKIGNTGRAGKTTVVVSERGGKKLLAVVLGAPTITKRDLWAAQLLDYGFAKTLGLKPVSVTEEELHAKYATWNNWR